MTETVDHPQHYNSSPSGVECIDVVEHMPFNIGNAIKYLWRAGQKGDLVEDLRKAAWYIEREIQRVKAPKTTGAIAKEFTFGLIGERTQCPDVVSYEHLVRYLPPDWNVTATLQDYVRVTHQPCQIHHILTSNHGDWTNAAETVRTHQCPIPGPHR